MWKSELLDLLPIAPTLKIVIYWPFWQKTITNQYKPSIWVTLLVQQIRDTFSINLWINFYLEPFHLPTPPDPHSYLTQSLTLNYPYKIWSRSKITGTWKFIHYLNFAHWLKQIFCQAVLAPASKWKFYLRRLYLDANAHMSSVTHPCSCRNCSEAKYAQLLLQWGIGLIYVVHL